jgi:hypothetical protein
MAAPHFPLCAAKVRYQLSPPAAQGTYALTEERRLRGSENSKFQWLSRDGLEEVEFCSVSYRYLPSALAGFATDVPTSDAMSMRSTQS